MLRLRDAKLTDSLPQIIAQEPWAQAMAYAVNKQINRLLTYADGVQIFASIDTLPDHILDILAVELRLPYYEQTFSPEVKRELIKGALLYWATTGTVESLTKVLTSIFGDARIEEWFEYSGEPGYFRIITTNPQVTGETLERFTQTARNVKRMTAWLEEVLVEIAVPPMNIYKGFALYDHTEITLKQEG